MQAIDTTVLDQTSVKEHLCNKISECKDQAHKDSKKWSGHNNEVNHLLKVYRDELKGIVNAEKLFKSKHDEAEKEMDALTGEKGKLTLEKAQHAEQQAAYDKCLVEQRQLRNDRNKEISAADEANWEQFKHRGSKASKLILDMMDAFCPGSSFLNKDVDFMKTKFRACPAPKTDDDVINSDTCRTYLTQLKGGEADAQCGEIFTEITNENAVLQNVCVFPYYRAVSKQVHWFMVARKALVHKNAMNKAEKEIAKLDRELWKAELNQQAYSVYDDFVCVFEDIRDNEIKPLKAIKCTHREQITKEHFLQHCDHHEDKDEAVSDKKEKKDSSSSSSEDESD